jgi:hypothetical protein
MRQLCHNTDELSAKTVKVTLHTQPAVSGAVGLAVYFFGALEIELTDYSIKFSGFTNHGSDGPMQGGQKG